MNLRNVSEYQSSAPHLRVPGVGGSETDGRPKALILPVYDKVCVERIHPLSLAKNMQ